MSNPTMELVTATNPIPPGINGLPLTPIERFLLRNDTPAHPMVFRVLLRFDGPVRSEYLQTAFDLSVARQPMLTSLVQGEELGAVWNFADRLPELEWQPEGLAPEEIPHVKVDYCDLRRRPGLRCRIWPIAGGIIILIDIHHACCDGQGARQLIAEWFGIYQQLIQGESPRLPTLAYDKLKARADYRVVNPPIGTFEGLKNLYLTVRGRTTRLPEKYPDCTEADYLCEYTFSAEETATLRGNLKNAGFTINDAGLAASFSALVECCPSETRKGYITLMHPVDLRWPSDLRTPACNLVGVTFMRRKQKACLEPNRLIDTLRNEMRYIKKRYVGAEFLRGLAAADGFPGGPQRIQSWGWFVPTLQFTCLGDTTRALHYRFNQVDGVINFGGMKLDRISGFMQLGGYLPISLAACETNQKLSLTARISSKHFDRTSANDFLNVFVQKMISFGSLQ
jgi:hypothetical protein